MRAFQQRNHEESIAKEQRRRITMISSALRGKAMGGLSSASFSPQKDETISLSPQKDDVQAWQPEAATA